ncbi:MAG: M15 family metallopeptidase [Methyloligella sp. ZOD6]
MATTSQLRRWWRKYECKRDRMVRIAFCEDSVLVASEAKDAFAALAAVLDRHGYTVRPGDTDSYNCRAISGGSGKSLHSFGIALDINWNTNPYRDHPGQRNVRYSDKATQEERAADVRAGLADTDMTRALIADILAIKTVDGGHVFQWGGDWTTLKDTMHFQIDLPPDRLSAGIDTSSVTGSGPARPAPSPEGCTAVASAAPRYRVIARSGLRLRSGPGTRFGILSVLPRDTIVYQLGKTGAWMLVSLETDGLADGHMHGSYLERETAPRAA